MALEPNEWQKIHASFDTGADLIDIIHNCCAARLRIAMSDCQT